MEDFNGCPNNCSAQVIGSKTLCECESWSCENVPFAKIPVVLAEFTVQLDVESTIKLADKALDIKRIHKSICLNQCRLIPFTKKVFLKGLIRKNIEYTAIKGESHDASCICGEIKDVTCSIPFHCVTQIDEFAHPPCFTKNKPEKEIAYLNDKEMCRDFTQRDLVNFEHFNEKVTCELERACFYEADIEINDCDEELGRLNETPFDKFTEKDVVYLTIKLLQKQQVSSFPSVPSSLINPLPPINNCDNSEDD